MLDRTKTWATNNLPTVFGFLRLAQPNLRFKNFGLITRFNDVQEALSRPDVFGVTYAEKMDVITDGSNFFLGMNNTPTYSRDVSNMRLVVRRSDIEDRVAPLVEQLAADAMADAGSDVDLVQELTRLVPARLTAEYMGITDENEQQLIDATTTMFQYLLGRCLALQASGTPGMSDVEIRNNLIGIIIGLIPTTSKCAALVLDYLLDHPELLAGAKVAAERDDNELLRKYVLESLRLNSFGPGVFRETLADYRIASGTLRSRRYPRGCKVLVATQSGMLDPRQVKKPKVFSLDRPDYHYMHFGYGMHTCFGQYINMVQIPIIVKAALKRPGLARLPGSAGVTQYDGPFPSHLKVQYSTAEQQV
jgi:cytochrome P450